MQPTKGVLTLLDHIATVLARGVKEVAQVASEAFDLIDKDDYDKDEWVQERDQADQDCPCCAARKSLNPSPPDRLEYADAIVKVPFRLNDADVDADRDRELKVRV